MHATLRSLSRCIAYANHRGYSIEIVLVVDNADEATKRHIDEYAPALLHGASIVRIDVAYGDLGTSRNDGLISAHADIAGVLDADDIISENMLTACIETIRNQKQEVVVYPQYVLSFGAFSEFWQPVASNSPAFDSAFVVEYNPYPAQCFARISVWRKYPYLVMPAGGGFGPEDWQWNLDTIAGGIQHIPAPQTAFFYRRKPREDSLAAQHATHGSVLDKTKLLGDQTLAQTIIDRVLKKDEARSEPVISAEAPRIKTKAQKIAVIPRFALARAGRSLHPILNKHVRTRKFEHHLHNAFSELLATSVPPTQPQLPKLDHAPLVPKFPDWLLNEWRALHAVEHRLFPDEQLLNNISVQKPHATQFSFQYWWLLAQLYLEADYVFLIPWLREGGADLVALNYIQSILDIRPKARIVVIATNPEESTNAPALPPSVRFIHLSTTFHDLSLDQQTRLLATLLIQTRTRRVHLMNSHLGFETYKKYSVGLSKRMNLFMSLFSVDILPNGRKSHLALDALPSFSSNINKIFTDNQAVINQFRDWFGYPESLFEVHYQPMEQISSKRQIKPKLTYTKKLRVLWAARIDYEKRPDILADIAKACRNLKLPIIFEVYGNVVLDDGSLLKRLKSNSNIMYKGKFYDGLQTLPLDNYDLFLLTSQYEGMPNTLLEAINGNLPVMAPDVGGVAELVNEKTGYLISSFNDVNEYVDRLAWIIRHPEDLSKKLGGAQQLLRQRHSKQSFITQIKRNNDYIS
jgi:glycosyltransferase involved in cell wall biosynthesis